MEQKPRDVHAVLYDAVVLAPYLVIPFRCYSDTYPYLIFYEATDGEIIVHHVRHSARRPIGTAGSA